MRRDGVVFSKLRHEHLATNRTVRHASRYRQEDLAFVVEPKAISEANRALKSAASFLEKARRRGRAATTPACCDDLEVVGLYTVECPGDMDATHAAALKVHLKGRDEVKREAAKRLRQDFAKRKAESQAIEKLGFGSDRELTTLTQDEWRRVNNVVAMPCISFVTTYIGDVASKAPFGWLGRGYSLHRVERASEIVPRLERMLRRYETMGWYRGKRKPDKGTIKATRWWREAIDDCQRDDYEDDTVHGPCVLGECNCSSHHTNMTLFDFVDIAMSRHVDFDF
ncbi:Aste57867_13164 [Aphanomyces stellatus]|uniref:Aste57867_13164 protein n=1 Tax=Aphanomyces stellatus TaxID=120398 RepID=A0A485KXW0_9STRA|nr:hypothetical protein As57867_013115 [Aphanomyces stellatus]VFT90005.1 Aste57867_13164 [Aphanomyces stellatus]